MKISDYYKNCAFPKPGNTKVRKKVNGYKNKAQRTCLYCGTAYADRHEIFGGPNRQTSIDMGFQIDLCRECHTAWHESDSFIWQTRRAYWYQYFQERYENKLKEYGIRPDQARDCWMKLIGKNYL